MSQIVYIDLVGLDVESAGKRLLDQLNSDRRRLNNPPSFPGENSGHTRVSNTNPQIPNLIPITDYDRKQFIVGSFEQLAMMLEKKLELVRQANPGFEYTFERVDKRKLLVNLYIQGKLKCGLKAWLSSWFSGIYKSIIRAEHRRTWPRCVGVI